MVGTKIRNLALGLALMSVVSLVSYRLGQTNRDVKIIGAGREDMDLSLMWKVKDRLSGLFLEKEKLNDEDKLMYGAVAGMVEALDDPYTMFLPPTDNKASNEDLAGEFGGVGISLGYKDKTLAVMSPLKNTPADKAGIEAGDLILKIIDENKGIDRETTDIGLDEAVSLIRGKVGSKVTLKIFREGTEGAFDVILTRDNIVVPSIELEWQEKDGSKVAWIKLNKFTERLYQEWDETVDAIIREKKNSKVAGVVLDVRNNPGGYLQTSVMIASEFLTDGVVVKQESSDGTSEVYKVDSKRGKLREDRLTVLVNGGSASASEILAGALKDHNRGKLVGEKTFGKGTVQQPENFADGSGLHVTIARWLLPSGKNIHGEGVMPDVEVEDNNETEEDEQLLKAIEVLISNN